MSWAACAVCGGDTDAALTATDRNRRISAARFAYRRCRACSTLQLVGAPADLGRYYPPSYYAFPPDRATLLAAAGAERDKLDLVRPFAAAGRLVEIGPAVGSFVVVMQEAGYDCSAIEMDGACCRFLREVVGVPAHQTDDPATVLASGPPFDVVAMWHVIEHVPNPVRLLAAAAGALSAGGIIVLATPNPDSLQFRLLGTRWAHLDAPRHQFLIPASELARQGRELGLEAALLTTRDPPTRGWNLFGWRESLAAGARRPRAGAARRLVGSVLTRLAAPLERREGQGSTYTLVLRRPA